MSTPRLSETGEKIVDKPSRLGKFIQTYHSFLSTFVIGAAGLVATSTWQYRQSEIARQQAESQARISAAQADNSWRIERAEILSKNLNVLASTGPDTVEQRYGVLLSLTRGNILDTELAVSYALELGMDSPTYMESVLLATPDKSYLRLENAYELTCQQRFGLTRDVPICIGEHHVERSLALADLFADEMEAARKNKHLGPAELLSDERSVQNQPLKLTALFGQYLTDLFERRQWPDIQQFEAASTGARLVSALVLAPTQPNSFVAASEAGDITKFHDDRAEWLRTYLLGATCNGECKGKLVDVMLTSYAETQGRYDKALLELFARPRAEVAMALARIHSRLLQCQVADDDATALRDHVLVPALIAATKRGREADQTMLEDLLSLLALTPDPAITTDSGAQATRTAWESALAGARIATGDIYARAFTERRSAVQVTRKAPPAKLKRSMFCTAEEVELADVAIDDE
jgi:hypothetical protein